MKLSPRQTTVAELVMLGLSIPEMALELKVSKRCIRAHLNRIYNKRGIENDKHSNVVLAVSLYYECHPEDVPFSGGDRASNLGLLSASAFAAAKLNNERRNSNAGTDKTNDRNGGNGHAESITANL